MLTGTKTEPTYIEHIRLRRDRDLFILQGGGPMGTPVSRESVIVAADGTLSHRDCPAAMDCASHIVPSGFLASAAILAAIRHGGLAGAFVPRRYGAVAVICIPAERIGVQAPVLDPCVETRTGAVVAQRHRLSKQFDGPSLDPWSIGLSIAESRVSSLGPHQNKVSTMPLLSRLQFTLGLAAAIAVGASVDASAADKLKVAILTPGLANDGSFNQVALEGVKKLAKEGCDHLRDPRRRKDPRPRNR